jgi:hypothetical protein
MVYIVVQARFIWAAIAGHDHMEITMNLAYAEANFRLDSFNRRSGHPDD